MLVPGTSSYDEDVTSNLLDFITETTPVREANDDIADQEQEAESWINYIISIQFNYNCNYSLLKTSNYNYSYSCN